MLSFDQLRRVAIATAGALVLSTLSVAAAVGPAGISGPAPVAIASVQHGIPVHG